MEIKKKSNKFTYNEMRKLLNHMLSVKDILNSNGYKIKEYGNIYCPFHDNEDTPAAKYYPDSNSIWCFSEHRNYGVIDALKLVGIDYKETFRKLWDSYDDAKKDHLTDFLDGVYETKVLFKESLAKFNAGVLSYDGLCADIVDKTDGYMPYVRLLHNVSRDIEEATLSSDDYTYLACFAGLNNIKQITSGEILKYKDQLKAYIYKDIIDNKNVILVFNMYKNIPFGCTLRNMERKKFVDVGNAAGIFYGLCDMEKDFKYGDQITIVEGPKDCETYRKIFKDKNCIATMTSKPSIGQLYVLKKLTNNIVLALDNDNTGKNSTDSFVKYNKKDFKINVLKHPDGIKDFGDLIPLIREDRQKLREFVNYYKIQMNTFV